MSEKKENFNPETSLAQSLDSLLAHGINNDIFSGVSVGVSRYEKGLWQNICKSKGKTDRHGETKIDNNIFIDLASLTKPLATTLAIASLISEDKIKLSDSVAHLLGSDNHSHEDINIRHLLCHCSGLPAHVSYYKKLIHLPVSDRKRALFDMVMSEKSLAKPGEKEIYSDLGFMLLAMIVEKSGQMPLDRFVATRVMGPIGYGDKILFNPPGGGVSFLSTGKCRWQGKELAGEVHDDNTRAIGGVSGQAGLFAPVAAVTGMCSFLLDLVKGRRKHPFIDGGILAQFWQRQDMVKGSSWALGFDTPSSGYSSAGDYLSRKSIGHLGFTGTSFWIDPTRDLVIVLLSNRVICGHENNKIRDYRPLFHNRVVKSLALV